MKVWRRGGRDRGVRKGGIWEGRIGGLVEEGRRNGTRDWMGEGMLCD